MEGIEDDKEKKRHNVYVGSECGVLKGICFGEMKDMPVLRNYHSFSTEGIEKKSEVVSLTWNTEEDTEKELFVGLSNNTVKVYNTKLKAFTHGVSDFLDLNKHGRLLSVYGYKGKFLLATDKAQLVLWDPSEDKIELEISAGDNLAKFVHCPSDSNLYATGGKETELKLWNLQSPNPQKATFKAKNVPHDELDLRVPVWVQDITFLPGSTDLVAISSRHGHVRLYDIRASERPTVNMKYVDHSLIAISTANSNDRHVLVGSGQGILGLIDLRNANGSLVKQYLGYTGGVRSICAHSSLPYFVSCGLDRHLYLHNINDKTPEKKMYLKTRLNCVVMVEKEFKVPGANMTCNSHNISMDVITDITPCKTPKKEAEADSTKRSLVTGCKKSNHGTTVPPKKKCKRCTT